MWWRLWEWFWLAAAYALWLVMHVGLGYIALRVIKMLVRLI